MSSIFRNHACSMSPCRPIAISVCGMASETNTSTQPGGEIGAQLGAAQANIRSLGRYQLRREIGRGAMGIVYEAYDQVLERAVAVKTVNAGIVDADERP